MNQDFPLKTMQFQGVKALNKPITMLWLLGQYHLSGITEFHFAELELTLNQIIEDYTGIPNVVDPFWRLHNDGILFFPLADKMHIQKSGRPAIRDLRKYGSAVFTDSFLQYISKSDNFIEYCKNLLLEYFPGSYDDEILDRTGLNEKDEYIRSIVQISRRPRDPNFRKKIINAYESRCAICGFELVFRGSLVANEAAHIKWHNSNGPDHVRNGLLLCNLHHKLFDCGVYTVSDEYQLAVSKKVPRDSESIQRWILDFEDKHIMLPRKKEWYPGTEFLSWHRQYVFNK